MRKLFPNLTDEEGLDTVLEVPLPEETFLACHDRRSSKKLCVDVKSWVRPHGGERTPTSSMVRAADLQLMLGVMGAPLVPFPVHSYPPGNMTGGDTKDEPLDVSMAKYIVKQYVSAAGGEKALNAVQSMYAMGKVRMTATEIPAKGDAGGGRKPRRGGGAEVGGFVLWQRQPGIWCLELMVTGCKYSAGSDGSVAWRQTPWNPSRASRGPPRPLRRSLQGLDPRSTASLFADSVCLGERAVDGEPCFVLRLDAETADLRAHTIGGGVEIIRHTVWGCFSQRTGLLVHLEDTHLLRVKSASAAAAAYENAYWETTIESTVEDYRTVDGVKIAHAGKTSVSFAQFGEGSGGHTRTLMEETWAVEEVEFNILGLSMDCFLPPADDGVVRQREGSERTSSVAAPKSAAMVQPAVAAGRTNDPWEFAAVESDGSESTTSTVEDVAGR